MSSRRGTRAQVAVTLVALAAGLTAVLGTPGSAGAQQVRSARPAPLYTPLPDVQAGTARRMTVAPRAAAAYRVNLPRAHSVLDEVASGERSTFTLPDPDGHLETFTLEPDPVMAPALAAAHPEITTWAGRSVADPRISVRVDLSPMGLHASVRSLTGSGTWYVDPAYVARGTTTHLSYYAADLPPDAAERTFVEHAPQDAEAVTGIPVTPRRSARAGGTVVRRTYRLAMINDPTYATYFGSANVLAEKVSLINRVNQIYNDDLAVHLVLIDGTDALNLDTTQKATQANGPCGSSRCFPAADLTDCGAAIGDIPSAVDRLLGNGNAATGRTKYDVGHLVLGTDGGGLAGLGVVGGSRKAEGCTGVTTPTGDLFYVDYVAHELGHQFGANHTFAGTGGSCSGNGNPETAVEPGSGSSVMAYAGICKTDDLQPHTDPYFSHVSIAEIQDYLASVSDVGVADTTTDHAPTVTAPAARTIPKRTPFTLTASGSDTDSDPLTYLWEESDPGLGTKLLNGAKSSGPLFRVFGTKAVVSSSDTLLSPSPGENTATSDPSRTFPDLAQIVAGNTDAATGSCPAGNVDCFSEFLPTGDRSMTFAVTARDGFATGGGTARDDVTLTVDGDAGPFLVTSQAGGEADTSGTTGTVTWAVNNTQSLAPQVRVLLSTDGGVTFPTTLVDATANDGSVDVTWPVGDTSQARVMVQAVGNYFFAVNSAPFTIQAEDTSPPETTISSGPPAGGFALADTATIGFASSEVGSSFECTLDAGAVPCAGSPAQLDAIGPGTHAFSVAATDSDSHTDPTPAVLRWSRPYGAAALTTRGSGWTSSASGTAYLGRTWQTTRRGIALKATVPAVTRVALVVATGRGYGRVQVRLGGITLGTINLSASQTRHGVLKVLPAFSTRSGTLTFTTLDAKPVRIEGFGVLTTG